MWAWILMWIMYGTLSTVIYGFAKSWLRREEFDVTLPEFAINIIAGPIVFYGYLFLAPALIIYLIARKIRNPEGKNDKHIQ